MSAVESHFAENVAGSVATAASLRHAIPDSWDAFTGLRRASTADGVIPARLKEVMALAISVVKHCDGCIEHHARAAARHGASPEEVAEGLAVALLMDGGPATVYGPRAWALYQQAREA